MRATGYFSGLVQYGVRKYLDKLRRKRDRVQRVEVEEEISGRVDHPRAGQGSSPRPSLRTRTILHQEEVWNRLMREEPANGLDDEAKIDLEAGKSVEDASHAFPRPLMHFPLEDIVEELYTRLSPTASTSSSPPPLPPNTFITPSPVHDLFYVPSSSTTTTTIDSGNSTTVTSIDSGNVSYTTINTTNYYLGHHSERKYLGDSCPV